MEKYNENKLARKNKAWFRAFYIGTHLMVIVILTGILMFTTPSVSSFHSTEKKLEKHLKKANTADTPLLNEITLLHLFH